MTFTELPAELSATDTIICRSVYSWNWCKQEAGTVDWPQTAEWQWPHD
jgi:hypothetical protein